MSERHVEASSAAMQLATGLGGIGVGAVMAALAWASGRPDELGTRAGLALGVGISLAGGAMLVLGGRQTITIEPSRRAIVIANASRFSRRERVLPFSSLRAIRVGEVGDDDGGSTTFHVEVELVDGSTIALYAGFYEGRTSREAALVRARRVAAAAGVPGP